MCGRLLIVLFFSLLTSCNASRLSSSQTDKAQYDAAAYAVYSGLLSERDTLGVKPGSLLVIQEETSKDFIPNQISQCMSPPRKTHLDLESAVALYRQWQFDLDFRGALADFGSANSTRHDLTRQFAIQNPYEILPSTQIGSLVEGGKYAWDGFYRNYPDSYGYIAFSAVGFNRERTRAIVSAYRICGFLCGGGLIYAMEKVNRNWIEVGAGCGWMS